MIFKHQKLLFAICAFCLLASIILLAHQTDAAVSAAPNITFTTLQGKQISMDSLKGKIVLVSFWATYCPSCNKEMPDLINTYNAYQHKGFEVIAVAVQDDPASHVIDFAKEKNLPFPVVVDGLGKISPQFGDIEATPTAFLFDQQGKLIKRTVGILDFTALTTLLNKELS